MALVGESGSGKSTLGKLITGLFEPRSGRDPDRRLQLRAWGRERLSNIVASVDQDIRLFSGTVHDNVTLWDDTVDHGRLVAAIDDAGLTPAIRNHARQFRGHRSRKAAAISTAANASASRLRAPWSANPAILVLDEATAAPRCGERAARS